MIIERPLRGKVDVQAFEGGLWVTYIANATGVSIRRGGSRDGLGVKTDVGLCSFTLKNTQDPLAGGTFVPGQAVRVVGLLGPLFTGRLVDIASAYPLDKQNGQSRAMVTVTVADAVRVHASTPRYGVTIAAGFETFESRINRLAGSAQAPVQVPTVGAPREVYSF
ncbi:hypothetical protein EV379_3113 [Microterricola gilva]|uniref:Uncharacterized protein n=1 Tax=Microterricola gilva TaxID=393267 RepID=A0A4Q8AQ25_9MICO|nr:hypothetical protein [Microterricola gilva]RZU66747.1 hypothetical protein EV379_3113 [Microterricola gilva]